MRTDHPSATNDQVREALEAATRSLEWIAKPGHASGAEAVADALSEVRLYAASRARVARAALSAPPADEREAEPSDPKSATKPVCDRCNDTHLMMLGEREVMCTSCPAPCHKCRRGGTGAFCETTPCACECHRKTIPPSDAAGVDTDQRYPRLTITALRAERDSLQVALSTATAELERVRGELEREREERKGDQMACDGWARECEKQEAEIAALRAKLAEAAAAVCERCRNGEDATPTPDGFFHTVGFPDEPSVQVRCAASAILDLTERAEVKG